MSKQINKSKCSLIICREEQSLNLVANYNSNSEVKYILASENLLIQNEGEKITWIDEVTFIEKIESYYVVGNEVVDLHEIINNWLKKIADMDNGFPEEIIFFTRHVEGGITTQRIQDALLLIRSYLELFKKFSVDQIILVRSKTEIWEDDLLIETAKSRNIFIEEIVPSRIKFVIARFSKKFRSFLYEPYYLVNYLLTRIQNITKTPKKILDKQIIFQLCGSESKHVENSVACLTPLEQKNYNPLVLCWEARKGAAQIREMNHAVDQLENWISLFGWIQSYSRIIYTLIRLVKLKKNFINNSEISYSGIELGSLLWSSVIHLIVAELGQRWRLSVATKAYFKVHKPLAINTWGINDLPYGRITLNSLGKLNPMLFKYSLSTVFLESPYRVIYERVNLYLVGSKMQKKFNTDILGKPEDKVEIVGQPRYKDINGFKEKYSRKDSLKILNIPVNFTKYIAFDLSNGMRGYVSEKEVNLVFHTLTKFVNQHKNIALIVKPHPGAKNYKKLFNSDNSNIFFVEKHMLPYHVLNCSDIFITKYSTMGIEAMFFNVPVISVILDNEKHWRVYKDSVDYLESIDELLELLINLIKNDQTYETWKNFYMSKQKEYLKGNFDPRLTDSSGLMADAIIKHIKKNQIIH